MKMRNRKSKKRRYSNSSPQNTFHNKLALGFISWAENYTSAITEQLKYQVEYWKARALAAEQDIKTLHKIIQKNEHSNKSLANSFKDHAEYFKKGINQNKRVRDHFNNPNGNDEYLSEDNNKCRMEVSKEFIIFLAKNKGFKEQARLERERIRLQQDLKDEEQLARTAKAIPTQESMKALYGKDWERICTMETALSCDWISQTERHKSSYWPIVPFNNK